MKLTAPATDLADGGDTGDTGDTGDGDELVIWMEAWRCIMSVLWAHAETQKTDNGKRTTENDDAGGAA
jgi:hypothetical protein